MAILSFRKTVNKHGINGWQYQLLLGGCCHVMTSSPGWYRYKRDARKAANKTIEDIHKNGLQIS